MTDSQPENEITPKKTPKASLTNIVGGYLVVAMIAAMASLFISMLYFATLYFYHLFTTDEFFSGFAFAFELTSSHFKYILSIMVFGSFFVSFFLGRSVKKLFEDGSTIQDRLGFSGAKSENLGVGMGVLLKHPTEEKALYMPKGWVFAENGEYFIIDKKDLLESKLYVDDLLLSRTTSGVGGSLAGAAVGGILSGGTGAIIGAIAGNNKKSESDVRIRKVAIYLTLKNKDTPFKEIVFYEANGKDNKGLKKGDKVLDYALNRANHWQAAFQNFINS